MPKRHRSPQMTPASRSMDVARMATRSDTAKDERKVKQAIGARDGSTCTGHRPLKRRFPLEHLARC